MRIKLEINYDLPEYDPEKHDPEKTFAFLTYRGSITPNVDLNPMANVHGK